jgi:hypothetical protein
VIRFGQGGTPSFVLAADPTTNTPEQVLPAVSSNRHSVTFEGVVPVNTLVATSAGQPAQVQSLGTQTFRVTFSRQGNDGFRLATTVQIGRSWQPALNLSAHRATAKT